MTDEETQDEGASPEEDAPVEEPTAPTEDAPAEEPAPPAEEVPAEETPAEEPAEDLPAADPAPAEEVPAEDAPSEEAPSEEPAAAAEPAAEEASDAPAPAERKKDEAPGANLEPIRLEEERELSAEERARLEAEEEERQQAAAAESDTDDGDEPVRSGAKIDLPAGTRIQATGKRKTAVARVVIAQGGGAFTVNKKELGEFFPRSLHQTIARQALVTSGYEGQVDVKVRVHGGGISGQADAVRHGIARALVEIDPELRGELKRRGMLTRDARAKERRKAGLKKARKRPQFSKR